MTLTVALNELGISGEEVGQSHVKHAYRAAMRKWHPDRFQTESEIFVATEKAQNINNAYELLSEHIEENGSIFLCPSVSSSSIGSHSRAPRHTYRRRQFTPGFP